MRGQRLNSSSPSFLYSEKASSALFHEFVNMAFFLKNLPPGIFKPRLIFLPVKNSQRTYFFPPLLDFLGVTLSSRLAEGTPCLFFLPFVFGSMFSLPVALFRPMFLHLFLGRPLPPFFHRGHRLYKWKRTSCRLFHFGLFSPSSVLRMRWLTRSLP